VLTSGGISLSDDGQVWKMWGEIDVAVAHEVHATLDASGKGRKTLDMRKVTFIDSSGVRLVLMACENEGRPKIVGASSSVRELFYVMSLDMLVDFVEPEQADDLGATSGHTDESVRRS